MSAPEPTGLLAEFMPADALDRLGWVDCLRWAVTEPALLAAFQNETGVSVSPAASLMDRLVDQATGVNEEVVRKFLAWFNERVWGVDDEDLDEEEVAAFYATQVGTLEAASVTNRKRRGKP